MYCTKYATVAFKSAKQSRSPRSSSGGHDIVNQFNFQARENFTILGMFAVEAVKLD